MLRGTTIDELMEAVARAEQQAEQRRASQQAAGREFWPQMYAMAKPELVEVA